MRHQHTFGWFSTGQYSPFEPTPGVYVRETLDVVANQLGLSPADQAQIVEGNARRLMPNLRA